MAANPKKGSHKLRILAIAVILLAVALVSIPFLIDANQFRPRLEAELSRALGREVKIGQLRISLISGGVSADDIVIGDDPAFSKTPFVRAGSLQVGVELKPLVFSREVHITGIRLGKPEINLIRSASGEWNFSSIGSGAAEKPKDPPAGTPETSSIAGLSVRELKVSEGRVIVIRAGELRKPRVYDKVELAATNLSFASVMPFTISAQMPGGGSFEAKGQAGPVNRTDVSLSPLAINLAVTRLDLLASGFVAADSGLTGLMDFNGDLKSDGDRVQSSGHASIQHLKMVKDGSAAGKPVSLDYSLSHQMKVQTGLIRDTKVEFGKAIAHLSGTYDLRGDSTVLKVRLHGADMPAEDLEALLPALGASLPEGASLQGGKLGADLMAEGPIEKLVTVGNLAIANARLSGFDLGSNLAVVASLAGVKPASVTEIEKFASDLRLTPDGIQATNLQLIVPALGQLTGEGTIGSGKSLNFRMTARLTTSGGLLGGLSQIAGVRSRQDLNVPFFIRGTTLKPAFIPDTRGVAAGILNSAVGGQSSSGQASPLEKTLGDAVRGLFSKKKK